MDNGIFTYFWRDLLPALEYIRSYENCSYDDEIIFLIWFFFSFRYSQVGLEVAHPGVSNDFNDEGAKKYYTYYQWVCFVLFFQVMVAIGFY